MKVFLPLGLQIIFGAASTRTSDVRTLHRTLLQPSNQNQKKFQLKHRLTLHATFDRFLSFSASSLSGSSSSSPAVNLWLLHPTYQGAKMPLNISHITTKSPVFPFSPKHLPKLTSKAATSIINHCNILTHLLQRPK